MGRAQLGNPSALCGTDWYHSSIPLAVDLVWMLQDGFIFMPGNRAAGPLSLAMSSQLSPYGLTRKLGFFMVAQDFQRSR